MQRGGDCKTDNAAQTKQESKNGCSEGRGCMLVYFGVCYIRFVLRYTTKNIFFSIYICAISQNGLSCFFLLLLRIFFYSIFTAQISVVLIDKAFNLLSLFALSMFHKVSFTFPLHTHITTPHLTTEN